MDQKTIDTYNQIAREYDEETKDFWDKFPNAIFDSFINITKGKVLDVGSGSGRDGLILKKAGFDVICFDASEEMIKISKERGLESILGDFNKLPFEDNMFDGVWAYTSLLHVPKKQIYKPLSEIYRVLKKGGTFGLGLIEGKNELYRESSGINNPRWFSFYTKDEIKKLVKEHGFEIEYFEEFTPKTKNYLNYILRKMN